MLPDLVTIYVAHQDNTSQATEVTTVAIGNKFWVSKLILFNLVNKQFATVLEMLMHLQYIENELIKYLVWMDISSYILRKIVYSCNDCQIVVCCINDIKRLHQIHKIGSLKKQC